MVNVEHMYDALQYLLQLISAFYVTSELVAKALWNTCLAVVIHFDLFNNLRYT